MTRTKEKKTVSFPDSLTPSEFAKKYRVNPQNVYFWIRSYNDDPKKPNIGVKEGKHWVLKKKDIEFLLKLKESNDRKKAKTVRGLKERSRSTESAGSLQTYFAISPKQARLLRSMFDDEAQVAIIGWAENYMEYREDVEFNYTHEKILSIMGSVLNAQAIKCIRVRDGYPAIKFLVLPNKKLNQPTIVYHIEDSVFYVEKPQNLLNDNEFYEIDDNETILL